ncbi:hypothetical protein [Candidatus Synchoanobacter obligatus]|uniref:Transmembrane cytochrome oxidase associated protein n=1 Tax=Candidatus Synchoanobacter obligatus TaxID=2919597 RepID=A0ABT1L5V5_9GAMM|nr:hypothetical protein [Candidatus Synchoanobacter obligatus]MCP8352110.1 hypothetical protein [Candidatus Synchoanobacter obligatus]
MKTNHYKLYLIATLFTLPAFMALVLNLSHYTGKLQNQGTWLENETTLTEIMLTPPQKDQYYWHIILPCENQCPEHSLMKAGLSTLNTKSQMAQLHTLSSDQLTLYGQDHISTNLIYLADPQQILTLKYQRSQISDLIQDLKRLLKPMEKR